MTAQTVWQNNQHDAQTDQTEESFFESSANAPDVNLPKDSERPAKVPAEAVEISEKNWKAYRHYRECVSLGTFAPFTLDPIVEETLCESARLKKAKYLERLKIAKLTRG